MRPEVEALKPEAQRMHAEGMNFSEIGEALGVSRHTVSRLINGVRTGMDTHAPATIQEMRENRRFNRMVREAFPPRRAA